MAIREAEETKVSEIDGVPLFDDRPIDFSGVGQNIDGIPLDQVMTRPNDKPANKSLVEACLTIRGSFSTPLIYHRLVLPAVHMIVCLL